VSPRLRVLRIYHSGVVADWRQRDRELRALGYDVRLVAPTRWNEGGKDVALDLGEDTFVTAARTVGHHPYRFVYDPRPIWRELRRRHLDVVDIHEEPASLAALEVRLLTRLARCPAVLMFYGAQNIEKRFPIPFRWIERASLRRAKGTYVCSTEAGEIFRRKGFRGRVTVIGLGVDVERFTPAPVAPPTPPLEVGYVGRLEEHKGVHVVLDAIAPLRDVHLTVVGDGPFGPELRERAHRLGLGPAVSFEGFSDHDTLPDIYRRFHVVVVPSLTTPTWVEQFGRVAVEAMASGAAVIVSAGGALPEIVGAAGVLVPDGDVAAWRSAIARLAADPGERARLVAAGTERARRYSWPAVAAAQAQFYEAVIR